MVDKNLDDDIIDLTDLLEEGQPPEKEGMEEPPIPDDSATSGGADTFDLGKEISLEDDVSIDDIEQEADFIDLDDSVPSIEEPELGQDDAYTLSEEEFQDVDKEMDFSSDTEYGDEDRASKAEAIFEEQRQEEVVLETAGRDFVDLDDSVPSIEEPELSQDDAYTLSQEEFRDADKEIDFSPDADECDEEDRASKAEAIFEEQRQEEIVLETAEGDLEIESQFSHTDQEIVMDEKQEEVQDFLEPTSMSAQVEEEQAPVEPVSEEPPYVEPDAGDAQQPLFDFAAVEPEKEGVKGAVGEESIRQLKEDMPRIIEDILRPMISELIKEIITASRDQIPVIVEKVIREEIEKLKKLD